MSIFTRCVQTQLGSCTIKLSLMIGRGWKENGINGETRNQGLLFWCVKSKLSLRRDTTWVYQTGSKGLAQYFRQVWADICICFALNWNVLLFHYQIVFTNMASEGNMNGSKVADMNPCSAAYNSEPSVLCLLLYVFLGIVSFITVCGNLLVIISIFYFKQLHTPTNALILSLAVADLLVGLLVFPFTMVLFVNSCSYSGNLACQVRGSFDVSLSTCSILNLCCISVDRYYAVCQPLTYRSKINQRVVLIMVTFCWSLSAIIGIIYLVVEMHSQECGEECFAHIFVVTSFSPFFSFYMPVVIMLCIYLKILIVAQRQARIIHNTTKSGAVVSRKERKATKTLATVMGVFLLCWLPFFICLSSSPYFQKDPVPTSLFEALNWLTLSNSMLNPFIYAFFYSWFRAAFRMIICGKIFRGDFANSKLS